ncbi:MAG: OmpH family outer membrane protein [Limisphaerales bacterium]
MKKIIHFNAVSMFGLATLLFLPICSVQGQNGPPQGGFDPQQMRQQMMQRLRDQFEIPDDAEWKLVSERITKVMDARRAANSGGGPGGLGRFGGPGGPPPNRGGSSETGGPVPPGGDGGQNPPTGAAFNGPPPGGFGAFPREPDPELEALQKAIDAKAPAADLKAKIVELKAARAKKQAELEKAREDLRQLLSARQEAIAMTLGLL